MSYLYVVICVSVTLPWWQKTYNELSIRRYLCVRHVALIEENLQ